MDFSISFAYFARQQHFFLRNFARKIGKQRARFDPLAYARRLTTVLTVRIFRKGQEKEQDTTYILQETEIISEFVSEFFSY